METAIRIVEATMFLSGIVAWVHIISKLILKKSVVVGAYNVIKERLGAL